MITAHDVKHLSELARLSVSEKELPSLVEELDGILNYVGQLNKFIIPVEKTLSIPPLHNVFREEGEPLSGGTHTETIVSAFPQTHDNLLSVKKILPL